jgi:hypothetical protein
MIVDLGILVVLHPVVLYDVYYHRHIDYYVSFVCHHSFGRRRRILPSSSLKHPHHHHHQRWLTLYHRHVMMLTMLLPLMMVEGQQR